MPTDNRIAPAGAVWVCGACGKRSLDLYQSNIDRGWDVSCMMGAVLCDEKSIELDGQGRVCKANAYQSRNRDEAVVSNTSGTST